MKNLIRFASAIIIGGFLILIAAIIIMLIFFKDASATPRDHYHFCNGNERCMADQDWAKQAWENTRLPPQIKYQCGGLYIGTSEATRDYYGALICARSMAQTDIMVGILQSKGYQVVRGK